MNFERAQERVLQDFSGDWSLEQAFEGCESQQMRPWRPGNQSWSLHMTPDVQAGGWEESSKNERSQAPFQRQLFGGLVYLEVRLLSTDSDLSG